MYKKKLQVKRVEFLHIPFSQSLFQFPIRKKVAQLSTTTRNRDIFSRRMESSLVTSERESRQFRREIFLDSRALKPSSSSSSSSFSSTWPPLFILPPTWKLSRSYPRIFLDWKARSRGRGTRRFVFSRNGD